MSMRSRARALQRATGLSYQQAAARIREIGAGPADLRRRTGWSLERCDAVLASAAIHAELTVLAPARRAPSSFQRACDAIQRRTAARAVIWIGADGARAFAGQPAFLRRAGAGATEAVRRGAPELVAELAVSKPYRVHVEPVARAGPLVVIVHEGIRIEPVRLVARAAAAILEAELSGRGWIPPRGGTTPSGAPAAIFAGVVWPTWSPPVTPAPN